MYQIPRLDLMVTYGCNLSCVGCISLSDRKRSGPESVQFLKSSFQKWRAVLAPDILTLFGGEPCLHPELLGICEAVRQSWPSSTIRLITNGYLLARFPANRWFDFEPFEMQISIHRKDHEPVINQQIKNILKVKQAWKVKMHGGPSSHRQMEWAIPKFSIYKSIFKDFVVPYQKVDDRILPWNSDPAESHKICGAPATPILYKDRLYKCPAVANTIDLVGESWYGYQGYDINDDIEDFVSNINRPEPICAQCPDHRQAVIIDHFDKKNIHVKTKNFN